MSGEKKIKTTLTDSDGTWVDIATSVPQTVKLETGDVVRLSAKDLEIAAQRTALLMLLEDPSMRAFARETLQKLG